MSNACPQISTSTGTSPYVVATRDSGVFQINLKRQNAEKYQAREDRLRVCQFCLARLNWNEFVQHRHIASKRNEIVGSFTLQEYYRRFDKTYVEELPLHTEKKAPLNDYTHDFKKISAVIKVKRNYCCDKCGVNLSLHKRFLHAHHKNGQQNDNEESNIEILCIEHHAEKYSHGHMKGLPEYKQYMLLKSNKNI